MRQFETVNQPSGVKRGCTVTASATQGRHHKRQRLPRHFIKDNEPSITDFTSQPRKSPRAKRVVRRDGYHGLDVMNEVINSAEGSDPDLETPNLAQEPSSLWSPVITVRPLVDNTPNQIADSVRPDDVFYEEPEAFALLQATQSHGQTPGNDRARAGQDQGQYQSHREVVHAAPISSYTITTGSSKGLERVAERAKPPLLHPSRSPTAQPATGPGGAESPIKFNYRVVLSRTPKTMTERWTPEGRFQEKTLAGLIKELPFPEGECQGLIFTIESSCMRTVERIFSDDEDGFASMKRYINMEIREWLARQRSLDVHTTSRLVVDIMIERMGDEKKEELNRLEDLELEW